jgi:hypothetical protein
MVDPEGPPDDGIVSRPAVCNSPMRGTGIDTLLSFHLRPSCRASAESLRTWGMLVDERVTRVTPVAGWLVAYEVSSLRIPSQAWRILGARERLRLVLYYNCAGQRLLYRGLCITLVGPYGPLA